MTYSSCHALGMLFFCLDLYMGVKLWTYFGVSAGGGGGRLTREYIR